MASRISGSRRRDWMTTNAAIRAIPASRTSQVLGEPQPAPGARTTAKTAMASPAVTVTAPARSMEPRRAGTDGMTPGVMARTAIAMGMLM
ncbi:MULTISPECIES: hypothetical protein [unclassified Streptomyces]|uniref:hypothetical protein n=1 Tax=unclassified Streptomyces TaxID=2593676 RepID=UPI00352E70A0